MVVRRRISMGMKSEFGRTEGINATDQADDCANNIAVMDMTRSFTRSTTRPRGSSLTMTCECSAPFYIYPPLPAMDLLISVPRHLSHTLLVRPLPPGCRLTAIFDSCHSGTAMDLPYIYSTEGKIKEPNLLAEAGQGLLSAGKSYLR